nr:hypothetical protein [Cryobacterium shii]
MPASDNLSIPLKICPHAYAAELAGPFAFDAFPMEEHRAVRGQGVGEFSFCTRFNREPEAGHKESRTQGDPVLKVAQNYRQLPDSFGDQVRIQASHRRGEYCVPPRPLHACDKTVGATTQDLCNEYLGNGLPVNEVSRSSARKVQGWVAHKTSM